MVTEIKDCTGHTSMDTDVHSRITRQRHVLLAGLLIEAV